MSAIIIFWLCVLWVVKRWFAGRARRRRETVEASTTFDAQPTFKPSHFLTDAELKTAGHFQKGEILAGYSLESGQPIFQTPKPGKRKPLLYLGGQGSGKTSAGQVPFSLLWPYSLVRFESTYEDSLVSSDYRRTIQCVTMINPSEEYDNYFRKLKKGSIGPLAPYWMGNPRLAGQRAAKLATGLVPINENVRDPYWDISSRGIARDVLRCMVELYPAKANMLSALSTMYDDPIGFLRMAARRIKNPELTIILRPYLRKEIEAVKSVQEVIRSLQSHIDPFLEIAYGRAISSPRTIIGELRRTPQTVIFANSLESMGSQSSNRFLAFCLEVVLAELQSTQFNGGKVPVCIQIDELAQFPKMLSLLRGMTSLRKYGAFFMLGINDVGVLTATYGKEATESFFENSGLVTWCSARSLEGSEYLSKSLGDIQVETYSRTVNWDPSHNWDNPSHKALKRLSVTDSHGLQTQRLMLPHELRELDGKQVVFIEGKPVMCKGRGYFEIDYLNKRASANPFAPL